MELFSKVYSKVGNPIVLLHGLFGNQGNWAAMAKGLAESFAVYSLDQRNHGKSPWSEKHDYQSLAADVLETMDKLGLEQAHLIGHSMGGKIAMRLALDHPGRVSKLVAVDIAPVAYQGGEYLPMKAMLSVSLDKLKNRQQAHDQLAKTLDSETVIEFLLTNLHRDKHGNYRWRCNLGVLANSLSDIRNWKPSVRAYEGPALFVKGSDSDYVLTEYSDEILGQFPNASLKVIENAGHWVHSEKPVAFLKIVSSFLNK